MSASAADQARPPQPTDDLVWTIGRPAAGPYQFSDGWFRRPDQPEPVFHVGRSEIARDWPRRQPTPLDARHGVRRVL